jgi:hypothetical protein
VTVVCDGLLVEYEDGVGECDQGDACQALELQDDYLAYVRRTAGSSPGDRPKIEKSTEARADRGRAIVPFEFGVTCALSGTGQSGLRAERPSRLQQAQFAKTVRARGRGIAGCLARIIFRA